MISHLIIGAGIAGLTLSRALRAPIIEKSKGLGGRLATRRIGDDKFDHGLPSWPVTPQAQWLFSGSFIPDGMTALAKKLAEGLEIHRETRALKLTFLNPGWRVECESKTFEAEHVILTAPIPQALELLTASNLPVKPEWHIPYHKALVGLYKLDVRGDDENFMTMEGHQFIFQRHKRMASDGLVLLASAEFSERNFELSDEEILEQLTQILKTHLPDRTLAHQEVKKWRYSTPERAHEMPYLEAAPGLFLCGDGFLTPNVDGALLSAQTLLREKFRVL